MDKDRLYFHFSNLALVLIGILSIQAILNPFIFVILFVGTIAGFLASWQLKDYNVQHLNTFIGMLSLAAVVVIMGQLFNTAITFENVLKILSTMLVWLSFFQSFGLKTGRSYAVLQFISVILLISSVGLALEGETFYILLLAVFLYIFIFTMRLDLVCEKKRKGSVIVGEQEEIMGLWQQIKVGALMFFFVFIVASFVYPFVPRFENLSMEWIPSTLFGIPEKIPMVKLWKSSPKTIKEKRLTKEEQLIDDLTKKRETGGSDKIEDRLTKKQDDRNEEAKEREKSEVERRFPAREFDKDIDILKIESITVSSNSEEVPLDRQLKLRAEIKMNDGSIIPATRLVDWKTVGTADVSIDHEGHLKPKEKGDVQISASYMGSFSNDLHIKITKPVGPEVKRSWAYYLLIILLWLGLLSLSGFMFWVFMKQRKLSELAVKDPKEFIKEVYVSLCRAFKFYGISRLNHVAYREFCGFLQKFIAEKEGPLRLMTEGLLEARFSMHEISIEDSKKMLGLFHEIKEAVLQRQGWQELWKKALFTVTLLDVILVPRSHT